MKLTTEQKEQFIQIVKLLHSDETVRFSKKYGELIKCGALSDTIKETNFNIGYTQALMDILETID